MLLGTSLSEEVRCTDEILSLCDGRLTVLYLGLQAQKAFSFS